MKVAISGHINLPDQAIAPLRETLTNYLQEALSDHADLSGISCLAPGADQLFAEVCHSLQIPYKAVLPCQDYSDQISEQRQKATYFSALERATSMQRLDYQEGSGKAYWAASQHMIEEADLLIAIWNEQPARGHGGTADVVKLTQDLHKPVVILNPEQWAEIKEKPRKSLWDILKDLPAPKTHDDDERF